ncbi:MAG: hypothetical protein KKI15_03300 [Proteobacteria bacterium]|nr:hypothetical protein [Pseudomonadota bacterium]MBU1417492.1 hypothetical protein [Pseudomonadota bacterium]
MLDEIEKDAHCCFWS